VLRGLQIRDKCLNNLLGLGHVMKGTPEMGNPIYEYEYADQYIKLSPPGPAVVGSENYWLGCEGDCAGQGAVGLSSPLERLRLP
jgi:hypothetical protein